MCPRMLVNDQVARVVGRFAEALLACKAFGGRVPVPQLVLKIHMAGPRPRQVFGQRLRQIDDLAGLQQFR